MANNAQSTLIDTAGQATDPFRVTRQFNVDVAQSPEAGELRLQRRYWNESAWYTVTRYRGPTSETGSEIEAGVDYRFVASDDFAGEVLVRIGQGV